MLPLFIQNFLFQKLHIYFCYGSLIKIYFYFTIIISNPGKSYFKNWNNILYSQRCFTFLSIFHLSRFGCTTSFSLSFNKPRKPKFQNEKISHGIQHGIDICFVSGKEISSFCPDISARETPGMEGERFEARNLRGSRIA